MSWKPSHACVRCAACAREKQHLLGQSLKEIQINQMMLCQKWLKAVISSWGFTNCPFTITMSQTNKKTCAILRNWMLWHLAHYIQLTFDRPKPPLPNVPLSSLPMTLFFILIAVNFSASDTWNSPARPPLKAQGSWSPLRNCVEDWLRHPVRSRAKRTLLPKDGALWHK